jgi:hypothetical protein
MKARPRSVLPPVTLLSNPAGKTIAAILSDGRGRRYFLRRPDAPLSPTPESLRVRP